MTGGVVAIAVLFTVFFCIGLIVATIFVGVMLLDGKLTLPRTNMRRLARKKAEVQLSAMELEIESNRLRHDRMLNERIAEAIDPSVEHGQEVM